MESETIISEQFYANSSSAISEKTINGSFFGTKQKSQKVFVERPTSPFGLAVLIGTFLLLLAGVGVVYLLQDDFEQFHFERIASTWGLPFLILTTILFFYQAGVFLYSSFLYLRYKAIPSVSDDLLPTCTIIVPAYNEGKLVWDTLLSLADSDYPAEKLQLLAIDDGSKDDTWYWMQEAKAKLGDRVTIFQQPKNQGKRQALYRGFKLGTGEIFVTVDSDSIVKKDTLRNLVSPFVADKKCGAVAGNVQVLNNKKAILPKMLNVSFVMSFEFQRSVESELGSVLCTPGALAAYKRDAVFNCLPEWINQTFMGEPSDIGEDRALTNMILKQGFEVKFQRNAVVLTNVPEEYKGLYKMFIRWARSNVRENLMMAKYVFTDFRKGSKFGARMLFLNQFFKIAMTYPFLLFMFYFIAVHPVLFLSSTLLAILIFSSFSMAFYAKRYTLSESFWAYSYSVFYTFSLFWIAPYAIATANKKGWLTRGL
ncbi:MAG: glycosyltransferase family 2 protein [Flavobacterium nitrogenifigens]|uniref:glycosyltransferase family 2 protein n=1 Tax=Flavobacterium nitrogenifigens TaxID=1617283 RepID=UPI002808D688|nr:glycosyltransferase family 2 protein [Flavobacterium nitrogenifigens]MDQ8012572.1 glycosyltransferase family 2 protein [Flavobacterium nitrogenifigens]